MLHISLRNKIQHPEIRVLYDFKIPCSQPDIENVLRSTIKKLRQSYNSHNRKDIVEDKLATYGNEGGWYVSRVKELVKAMYQPKGVSNEFQGQWRSIEFELIFKSKKDCEDFAILARQNGFGKLVHIHTDGSLRPEREGEQCNEVKLTYKAGDEEIVRKFCKLLRGRAYVNKTCGTHVHFDFRHVSGEEATLYGKRLARCVPALKLLLPAARRESEYCKTIINNYTQANSGGGSHARYAFVNMHAWAKYKTIEIRGHSGTINADKILNWIKLCEIIMATDLNFTGHAEHRTEVTTTQALIAQYGDKFDQNMINYINERSAKFAVNTADEAENVIGEQEVPTSPMFNPQPKKKEAPKSKGRKKKVVPAIDVAAIAGAPVNAPHEVIGPGNGG